MKKRFVLIPCLLLLALLSACGGNPGETSASAPSTEITVEMGEFMFEPANFAVPAGEEITLTLTNSGAIEHSLAILAKDYTYTAPFNDDDQANALQTFKLKAGESQVFTFTAPADPGEYQVVCDIAGHGEAGMVGNMKVVQP